MIRRRQLAAGRLDDPVTPMRPAGRGEVTLEVPGVGLARRSASAVQGRGRLSAQPSAPPAVPPPTDVVLAVSGYARHYVVALYFVLRGK